MKDSKRIAGESSGLKSSLKESWDRTLFCLGLGPDKGKYPVDIRELWDEDRRRMGDSLRDYVSQLVLDHPHIPANYIRGLLSRPTKFQNMGGMSPYQALMTQPTLLTMQNAKAVVMREVCDLDIIMTKMAGNKVDQKILDRSFFSQDLK